MYQTHKMSFAVLSMRDISNSILTICKNKNTFELPKYLISILCFIREIGRRTRQYSTRRLFGSFEYSIVKKFDSTPPPPSWTEPCRGEGAYGPQGPTKAVHIRAVCVELTRLCVSFRLRNEVASISTQHTPQTLIGHQGRHTEKRRRKAQKA